MHPNPENSTPVFCTDNATQLSYHQALNLVKQVDTRSGVAKDLSPHDFRRGRATYLAGEGWGERQLMEYFGWSDSASASRYIWLSSRDLEDAVLSLPS